MDILGLRPLAYVNLIKCNSITLVQVPVPFAFYSRIVDEHFLAAAIGQDETEALDSAEPLDTTDLAFHWQNLHFRVLLERQS